MDEPALLYKYVTSSTAEKILTCGSFRFSNPRVFNDPFDARLNFLVPDMQPILDQCGLNVIAGFLDSGRSTGNQELDTLLRYLQASTNNGMILSDIRNGNIVELLTSPQISFFIANLTRGLAICSFSETPQSMLMWSHYADSHGGVVLAVSKNFPRYQYNDNFPILGPARYERNFPFLSIDDLNKFQRRDPGAISTVATALLLQKSVDWSYEKEWRYITWHKDQKDDDFLYVPFEPTCLRAIYFGVSMDQAGKEHLTSLVERNYPNIQVFHMQRSREQFGVVPS